jgi:Na+/melibiose symporter-like transporter
MQEQNFKNHTRLVAGYHGVTGLLIISFLVGSIITFVHAHDKVVQHAAMIMIVGAVAMIGLFWYARVFALKAQDRAIRAEENFRHFILTGKPLDKQIRVGQIIALRFASDEEFPALAKKAAEEKLTPKQIKQAIQNWRADYHRV